MNYDDLLLLLVYLELFIGVLIIAGGIAALVRHLERRWRP